VLNRDDSDDDDDDDDTPPKLSNKIPDPFNNIIPFNYIGIRFHTRK
jgi:hypothetical protein